jgi:hypothetical protein
MKAIVSGLIASYPVGGVVWDYGQYALGLEQLGIETYYLEDTGWQTYDPILRDCSDDCSYGLSFLQNEMATLSPSLSERWHFRHMDGTTYGIPKAELAEVIHEADLFVNVSGSALLRDEYLPAKRKVLIDTDPGMNHFRNYPKWIAEPVWQGCHGFLQHDYFLTYAEQLGSPGCILPDFGLNWRPTRPPVVLNCWKEEPPGKLWTTVMSWKNFQKNLHYQGVEYGAKEMEFAKIEEIPRMCPEIAFEVAVGGSPPVNKWRQNGWSVVDSHRQSRTAEEYRKYIQSSRGELSVAKNVYVATGSGWFSCRSVCYLAAGRPVVVQNTGFSKHIPVGKGLHAFTTSHEAAQAIEAVESDYAAHQEAAREIAQTYFDSKTVLEALLRDVELG